MALSSSFSLITVIFSLVSVYISCSSILVNDSPPQDIHDILSDFHLPKGILPNAVKSYSLSPEDGSFTVEMEHSCYVNFPDIDNQQVYYNKIIKGKLTNAKVSGVSGIQAKMLFFWVPITGMEMDLDSGMVEFYIGALSQKLPAKEFKTIPTCTHKICLKSMGSALKLRLRSFLVNKYNTL